MIAQRFAGRVAVVTGAGSGIGRATAQRFAGEGVTVACLDVVGEAADATARQLGNRGVSLPCDVQDEAAVGAAIEQVASSFGRIDVLANVAGIGRSGRFDQLTLDEWDQTLAVNLTGTFLMCRAALPHLEATGGCIVNVASVAGVKGIAFAAAYAAAKGGVVALSRALAVELGDRNVRVRCVCPAGVDTPMVQRFRLPPGAAVPARAQRDRAPLMPPEEVAAAIVDLAGADPEADGATVVLLDPATPG